MGLKVEKEEKEAVKEEDSLLLGYKTSPLNNKHNPLL